ncbi:hypothetical protein [Marivivens aquimaris]|nr:hypothetical protein [Marivivens aquimaris]
MASPNLKAVLGNRGGKGDAKQRSVSLDLLPFGRRIFEELPRGPRPTDGS